jgi:hypothetical protein
MSLVWDVKSLAVDNASDMAVDLNEATIEITQSSAVPVVTLDVPNETQTVQVEVPGLRGPAGLKNVYIQPNNPAVEFGWGPEETNFIWIPTT